MRISKCELVDGTPISFGDFNVFIGGNGVGKSTLVSELYDRTTNRSRDRYRWIGSVSCTALDIEQDLQNLKNSLQRHYDGAHAFLLSSATKDINGNPDHDSANRFDLSELKYISGQEAEQVFGNYKYRRPFTAYSSCDARLGLPNEVARASLQQAPQDPINVLHRNRRLLKAIDSTMFARFGIRFVILDHTGTNLQLGTAKINAPKINYDVDDIQAEYERVEEWRRKYFSFLSEAGHGIRSMIRLLTSVVDPVNTVIMIDEPEMHLYPSHKRWLGRELVRLAKEQSKQVFLVTHDPIVLQGILDSNTTTSIIRVERDATTSGTAHSCSLEFLKDISSTRNQEQFLQGLFYQRCVVVEGATDRVFYQRFLDDQKDLEDKDIGFVACGGKGGTTHMAALSSKVGLKVCFIYDLDVLLFEPGVVRTVFKQLGGEGDPLASLWECLEAEATVNPFVRKDDAASIKARNSAIRFLTGYSPKFGVQSDWSKSHKPKFDEARSNLAGRGIFVVEKGELESWAPTLNKGARFAELAPDEIKKDESSLARLRSFLKDVTDYLLK